jgi:hypothetical protein
MRWFLVFLLLLPVVAHAGTGSIVDGAVGSYTVATLPSAGTGAVAIVVDGNSDTDCTTGGGSTYNLCVYSGAAWVVVGDGDTVDDVPDAGDFGNGNDLDANGEVANDSHDHTTTTVSGLDVSDDINLTAGRSLTLTDDDVLADPELYTDTKCIYIEDPTADDDLQSLWTPNGFAVTITKVWCESDQTVDMDLQIDDGTPADVMGTDLVCASTPVEDEAGLTGAMADGDRLDLVVTSVSGTPTWVSICWTYTSDD